MAELCEACQFKIRSSALSDWMGLYYFIQFLYTENYIELETYNELNDKLQTFKNFAFSQDE